MKLFVALVPPKEVVNCIQNLQVDAKRGLPAHLVSDERKTTGEHFRVPHSPWRMAEVQKLHLTLRFLGDEVTHHKSDDIMRALGEIKHSPFDIECAGIGGFPKENGAKVLWAGAKSNEMRALAKKIDGKMGEIGFGEQSTFSPHITIARCKFPSGISDFLQKNRERVWCPQKWRAESFSLIESVHVLGGHEYKTLQSYSLI